MKKLTIISALLTCAHLVLAQSVQFTADHTEAPDGAFNSGRVVSNATLDGQGNLAQWTNRGNAGLPGDGRVFSAFSRYKMFERDLYNHLVNASKITWTTGLYQKEKNREVDNEIGGHDVDWYVALDPNGQIVPDGETPSFENAWDWPNQLGFGWENTEFVGRVLQSEPMATDEEKDLEAREIPVDSPAMRITFDITAAIKAWIDQGLLTDNSTIAIGNAQRAAVIADEQGNPVYDDPNLFIHSQMVFEVANAYLTAETGTTSKGPGVFAEYDLVDGYVDTGDWLGWVYVADYPWSYVLSLEKYIYMSEPAGWAYVPK